mmetsp:Transcript_5233/g.13214  ORF Transcript_5233/g.13214 Transcript_5233/m.13214 type:complete len:265 (+) Transcript_5233:583-1377(+)
MGGCCPGKIGARRGRPPAPRIRVPLPSAAPGAANATFCVPPVRSSGIAPFVGSPLDAAFAAACSALIRASFSSRFLRALYFALAVCCTHFSSLGTSSRALFGNREGISSTSETSVASCVTSKLESLIASALMLPSCSSVSPRSSFLEFRPTTLEPLPRKNTLSASSESSPDNSAACSFSFSEAAAAGFCETAGAPALSASPRRHVCCKSWPGCEKCCVPILFNLSVFNGCGLKMARSVAPSCTRFTASSIGCSFGSWSRGSAAS